MKGRAIPEPESAILRGKLEPGKLLYTVGLPVPADDMVDDAELNRKIRNGDIGSLTPAQKTMATQSLNNKIAFWTQLFFEAPHGTAWAQAVTLNVFLKWLGLAERRLADEVDTILGLALGNRPGLKIKRDG